ncbi:hypothetical protein ABW21_db0200339 [Orbilia brochopaga]|nr:hypothetical protein ABW21_db0200339 [Drechslerella brochopaga]
MTELISIPQFAAAAARAAAPSRFPQSVRATIIDGTGQFHVDLTEVHFSRLGLLAHDVHLQLLTDPNAEPVLSYGNLEREAIYSVFDYCNFGLLRPDVYQRSYPTKSRDSLLDATNMMGCFGLKLQLLNVWYALSYGLDEKLETLNLFLGHCSDEEQGVWRSMSKLFFDGPFSTYDTHDPTILLID